jgi:branched-chain amino acid aminotransferase
MLVNINGKILSPEQATISVFDRGFLFGDSIYEVARTYNHIPFLLAEHLERLEKSANILGIPLSYSQEDLRAEILKTLKYFWQSSNNEAYIRLIITRGEGDLSLAASDNMKNNFIIIVKAQQENPLTWYQDGVSFIIADNRKTPKQTIDPNCKSGNHLPHVMALHQAKAAGAFDAIMLNQEGFVTEGTSNNIWIVKDGHITTPPLLSGILEGLTRKTILNIIKNKNITHQQTLFYPEQVYNADECFFTSSTRELVPIVKIDDQKIGNGKPGKIYKELHQHYHQYILKYNITQKQA